MTSPNFPNTPDQPFSVKVGVCSACKGDVTFTDSTEFVAELGPMIIGPAGANQYRTVRSYHCKDCGIMYAFPPPPRSS